MSGLTLTAKIGDTCVLFLFHFELEMRKTGAQKTQSGQSSQGVDEMGPHVCVHLYQSVSHVTAMLWLWTGFPPYLALSEGRDQV